MTLTQVKSWNGGSYDTLVMAGPRYEAGIASVCAAMGPGMLSRGTTATAEEIENAHSMLQQVVCGLARSLTRDRRDPAEPQDVMDARARLKEFLPNTFQASNIAWYHFERSPQSSTSTALRLSEPTNDSSV
jgi:hypothetical protein